MITRDWALERAIETLRDDPDYSNLKPYNLEVIAEFRAMRQTSAHWVALPQTDKIAEIHARRRLRDRNLSMCMLAELVEICPELRTPLVFIDSLSAPSFYNLELHARSISDGKQITRLEARKHSLNEEIRGLTRRQGTISKRRKAA